MEEIRKIILEKSSELFFSKGCRTVSIDDICTELRMSKKTFYQYFSKKEILIEQMLFSSMQAQQEIYEKQQKDKNAIDLFIYTIKQAKKNVDKDYQLFWNELKKYYPAVFKKFEESKVCFIQDTFTNNILKGMEEGYFRGNLDVEMLSFFHMVQIQKTFEMMHDSNLKFTTKRIVDFFIDLMIHLIANEKGLKYINEHYKD